MQGDIFADGVFASITVSIILVLLMKLPIVLLILLRVVLLSLEDLIGCGIGRDGRQKLSECNL